ncbi:MAG TPA: hypothetical protein VGD60_00290 [Candidatus Acidoferrales bacterium]
MRMTGIIRILILGAATICAATGATALNAMVVTPRVAPAAALGQSAAQAPAMAQSVGTVKAIGGKLLTLTLDSGTDVLVTVSDTTKIVQVAPGSKDLKSAVPIQVTDLAVGDRILVRHLAADDVKAMTAVRIIAMKATDVAAKKKQDLSDWQKSGVGGLVKEVDAAAGTITISSGSAGSAGAAAGSTALASSAPPSSSSSSPSTSSPSTSSTATPAAGSASKLIVIHTTKDTILRRYAPDSVKFDEAKAAPITQIQVGDQLRARGEKSADGNEFAATEIVSGTFRNIAGTINSVDAAAKTISMTDLITKKPVVVKVSEETQLKKLPPEMAMRIAMRLRGGSGIAGLPGSGAASGGGSGGGSGAAAGGGNGGGAGGFQRGAGGGGGRPDFQQLMSRLPASALTDFQKGDAVLVVSTEGTDASGVTAITLVGGVEAILAAAPTSGAQAALLSPWNLGGGAPGGEGGGTQ